ncbi:hypothetical protein [Shimazuella kribbensis]|uniref:hypothetical protein n=1 Tax=Shimazuella kribbensis TaxID=139808 RepID=UPI0004913BD1|nr:hypothetical protein [Shimazuella kribbensis]
MSAREYLEKANRYQVKPEELFQYFAQDVMKITVLYQKSSMGKKPLLARSNRPGSKYVVAFTDEGAAKMVHVRQPEFLEMTDEPTLPFLLKAYRSNAEGLMFNPGLDSRFFVVRHQLLEWIRYYCIQMFSKQSTVWVIRNGSSVLKGSYQPGFSTIVIYTGKEEASKSAEKSGGEATPVSWSDIFRYLEKLSSKTLYVNYGLPEAFLLNPTQVDQIRNGAQTGYVEQTTNSFSFIPEVSDVDLSTSASSDMVQEKAVTIPLEIPVEEEQKEDQSTEEIGDWESAFGEQEPLTLGNDRKISDTYTPVSSVMKEEQVNHKETISATTLPAEQIETKVEENITIPEKEEHQQEIIEPIQEKEEIIAPSEQIETKIEADIIIPEKKETQQEIIEPKQQEEEEIIPPVQEDQIPPSVIQESNPVQQENVEQKVPTLKKESSVPQTTYSAFDNPWDDDDDGFSEPVPHTSLFFQSNETKEREEHHSSEAVVEHKTNPIPEKTVEKPIEKPIERPIEKPISSLEPDSNHVQNQNHQPKVEKQTEQEPLHSPQKTSLPSNVPEDVAYGLRVLEAATNEGQGMANGWEVCRALADLRRIWVIVDIEGKMVILASQDENQIADFFTSEEYAQRLIDEAHNRNKSLPQMVPRLISTKKLFRALAPTQCLIWINRGSPNAWTSIMGDTLPYVLQLMAQK